MKIQCMSIIKIKVWLFTGCLDPCNMIRLYVYFQCFTKHIKDIILPFLEDCMLKCWHFPIIICNSYTPSSHSYFNAWTIFSKRLCPLYILNIHMCCICINTILFSLMLTPDSNIFCPIHKGQNGNSLKQNASTSLISKWVSVIKISVN
jgi:hypothetical protein